MIEYYIISVITIIAAYIVGAVPTAAWIANKKGIDITKMGSGNSGATNAGRLLGAYYFLIVFAIDSTKAILFIMYLKYLNFTIIAQCFSAIAILLGNGFSWFLRWKGGKGIATSFGILYALMPDILPLLVLTWGGSFFVLQVVGISSVITLLLVPLLTIFMSKPFEFVMLSFFITCWGLVRHQTNIKRYFYGLLVVRKE